MGKNKLQKFDEMTRLERVFEFPYGALQGADCPLKGHWHDQVFHNSNPIVLELGCGRGEYTVGLGELDSQKNYIGIDIKGARMWSGAKQANEKQMAHVAFLRTHIEMLASFFAPEEVSEIWITFPDPQMKKLNKRMTSTRFMQLYGSVLSPHGVIHLKCDSPFLYSYTKAMIALNDLALHVESEDIDITHPDDPTLSIETYYESQWRGRGISIKYLQVECSAPKLWCEPDIEIELDPYRSYNRSKRSANQTNKR